MARKVQLAIHLRKMKIASNNYWTALSNEETHGFHQSLKFVFEKVKFSKPCSRVDVHQ